jgi:hypothetical protein
MPKARRKKKRSCSHRAARNRRRKVQDTSRAARNGDLADLVLGCMAHLTASTFLSVNDRATLSEPRDRVSAHALITYLRGAGHRRESVRELAAQYASNPEALRAEGRAALSAKQLVAERRHLAERLADLPDGLAAPLANMLWCIDLETAEPSAHAATSWPDTWKFEREGLFAPSEYTHQVLRLACMGVLAALPQGGDIRGEAAYGQWFEAGVPAGYAGGVPVRRCARSAGWGVPFGHTRMIEWQGGHGSAEKSPRRSITIMDEQVQLSADLSAFGTAAHAAALPSASRLGWLERNIGGTAESRADLYRQWLDEFVKWHEVGHQRTDALMADAARRSGSDIMSPSGVLGGETAEILADAESFERCSSPGDTVRRQFMLANAADGDWGTIDAVASGAEQGCALHTLARLRSLHEPDPAAWLHDLAERIMRAAETVADSEEARQWCDREVQRTAKAVLELESKAEAASGLPAIPAPGTTPCQPRPNSPPPSP